VEEKKHASWLYVRYVTKPRDWVIRIICSQRGVAEFDSLQPLHKAIG